MFLSLANTSVSLACIVTEASIPAGAETVRCGGDGGVSGSGCQAVSLTLDHDVSNALKVVTHFDVERVQHGLQLQADDAAIFGRFGCCTVETTGIRGRVSMGHTPHTLK